MITIYVKWWDKTQPCGDPVVKPSLSDMELLGADHVTLWPQHFSIFGKFWYILLVELWVWLTWKHFLSLKNNYCKRIVQCSEVFAHQVLSSLLFPVMHELTHVWYCVCVHLWHTSWCTLPIEKLRWLDSVQTATKAELQGYLEEKTTKQLVHEEMGLKLSCKEGEWDHGA